MGLFSKKYCSICQNPAGAIGRKKLADGYVCKKCAADFSPFWSVWKTTTLSEVRDHLNYRAENYRKLSRFSPSIRLGEENALWIDPASGLFALCSYPDLQNGNPDLFSLIEIRECSYDIQMDQNRHNEGENDYYLYYFYLVVRLNSAHIKTARYRINKDSVRADKRPVLHDQIDQVYAGSRELRGRMLSAITGIDRKAAVKYLSYYALLQEMIRTLNDQQMFVRDKAPEENIARNKPPVENAAFCSWCGSRSLGNFCPSCGKKIER